MTKLQYLSRIANVAQSYNYPHPKGAFSHNTVFQSIPLAEALKTQCAIVILRGGLGDQLKNFIGGLLFSHKSQIPLYVFMASPSECHQQTLIPLLKGIPILDRNEVYNFMEQTFGIASMSLEKFDTDPSTSSFFKVPFNGDYLVGHILRNYEDARSGFYRMEGYHGECPTATYICMGSRIEYCDWHSDPELLNVVGHLLKTHVYLEDGYIHDKSVTNAVAMHVRRGDRVGLDWYPPTDLNFVRTIFAAGFLKGYTVYVYSDDVPECKKFLSSFPNVRFVSKVLLDDGLHECYSLSFFDTVIETGSYSGFIDMAQSLKVARTGRLCTRIDLRDFWNELHRRNPE